MTSLCGWHRPGNVQCEHSAFYRLEWRGPDGPRLARWVCELHLVPALDSALDLAPIVSVQCPPANPIWRERIKDPWKCAQKSKKLPGDA